MTSKIVLNEKWAIDQRKFNELASSDFGENFFKKSGEVDHKNCVDMVGKIAVLHIDGVLSYRSDIYKAWFGMDTYNSIGDTLDKLMDDDHVEGIVLSIDSPGGQVSGVSDLAEKIFGIRGEKPIVAHCAGSICSAAYWIGSACDKVVLSEIAEAGSIGCLAILNQDASNKTSVIRSNLSKNKALDPNTPEGRSAEEKVLDSMATVFIQNVAKYRGLDFDTVLDTFGQGAVFVGKEAVEIGMADEIDSLENVVKNMSNQNKGGNMPTEKNAAGQTVTPVASNDDVVKAAVEAERARISGVTAAFEGLALDGDCKKFIEEGKSVAEAESFCLVACKKQLEESRKASASAPAPAAAEPAAAPTASAAGADSSLTAEQRALIEKGIAASAAAANNIQAGSADAAAEADKALIDAFAAGAKSVH